MATGFEKLINLDRLEEFLALLEQIHPTKDEVGETYALSNDYFKINLSNALGNDSSVQLPVFYGTASEMTALNSTKSQAGAIYIYSDYRENQNGSKVPGIRLGDGNAYVGDLPYQDADFLQHMNNTTIHVSAFDRSKWDDKVTCFISPSNPQEIVFTKDYTGE